MKGYQFLRQKPLNNYIVDFFCYELMLVIEIDGDSHDYRCKEDQRRQKRLESLGITFLRFSDVDVKRNMEGVLQSIEMRINELEKHPPYPPQGGI
jgi:very-short-patch-repair endonuclease